VGKYHPSKTNSPPIPEVPPQVSGAQETLIENGRNYHAIFQNSRDALIVADASTGMILDANPAAMALLGRSLEEIRRLHQSELHAPEDAVAGRASFLKHRFQSETTEHIVLRADGSRVPVEIAASPMRDAGDRELVLGIFRDVTERRMAEQAVRDSAEKFRALFESSGDYIYIHDLEGNFLDMNPAALGISGYGRDEILSLNISSLLDAEQTTTALHRLRQFEATGIRTGNPHFRIRAKNGTFVDVETTITIIPYEGSTRAVLGIARDITERERAEKELSENAERFRIMSRHDYLTGLPNRIFMDEHLAQLMYADDPLLTFAIAYIDVDQFKKVNDIHGHATGDDFLRTAASRFRSVLREHDVLARIGGDEFIAVLAGISDRKQAICCGRAILESLACPFVIRESLVLQCTASIGIAMFPEDAQTIDDLKRCADKAMYAAKTSGRNRVRACDPGPLRKGSAVIRALIQGQTS
jgi:diguanylate cyclase (GGDEF)-like protein/PAS domain S-box-containing protein